MPPVVNRAATVLVALLNAFWEDKRLPVEWRDTEIVPVFKRKGDRAERDNYRPISPSACVMKIMETVMNHRLQGYLEQEGRIPDEQGGFRLDDGPDFPPP